MRHPKAAKPKATKVNVPGSGAFTTVIDDKGNKPIYEPGRYVSPVSESEVRCVSENSRILYGGSNPGSGGARPAVAGKVKPLSQLVKVVIRMRDASYESTKN